MDKRYQVFVSSTYEDLHDERREVMQALLALDCIPTGMELFPAADDDSWTHIHRFIAQCDYYVVIVGGRYGSTGPSGKSYTEMEYDYAVAAGLPVLAFLHKDPGTIPANKTEASDEGKAALAAFRKKIGDARHVNYWESSDGLAAKVAYGMVSLMRNKPRVGWVRADLLPDESAAQEMLKLRKRIESLETEIAETGFSPPAGSERLAQGEETTSLVFNYSIGNRFINSAENWSWNEIFAALGPLLISQASDSQLKEKLTEVFRNRYQDKNKVSVLDTYPRDEDFQRVKVQLRALGLIQGVDKDQLRNKHEAGWTLTPYGDRVMTQVAAVRSSAKA
jgi:hypothetical protein